MSTTTDRTFQFPEVQGLNRTYTEITVREPKLKEVTSARAAMANAKLGESESEFAATLVSQVAGLPKGDVAELPASVVFRAVEHMMSFLEAGPQTPSS